MALIFTRFKMGFLPIIAIAALAFTLYTVVSHKKQPIEQPLVMPALSSYHHRIAGIGVIEPRSENVHIGTELSGIVRDVIGVGVSVKAGDTLFVLDSRDADAAIEIAQAQVERYQADYQQAQALFDIVQAVHDTRAVSKDEMVRRRFACVQAQAQLEVGKMQLRQATITKQRLSITSPIDAEVLEVNIRPGEYASNNATNDKPLMIIGDTSVLHVRVEVDEVQAASITPEAPAEAFLRGDPTTMIPLVFVRFEPFVMSKQNLPIVGQRVDTRVLRIIYRIADKRRALFVGQQMDVFIKDMRSE
jgi:HlyD family secretion protein